MKVVKFFKLTGLSSLITLLFAAAALTGCSSDDLAADGGQTPSGEKMIPFTATIGMKGNSQGTRALTPGDGKIVTSWEVGDVLAIVFNDAKYTASVTEVAENGSATISGTVPAKTANGQAVQLVFPASAVTDAGAVKSDLLSAQKGTLADIAENYDLSIANGTLAVSYTSATLSEQVDFENQYAICRFTFTDAGNSNAAITGITKLVISDNSDNVITTATLESAATAVFVAMEPRSEKTTFKFAVTTGSNEYEGTAYARLVASRYYDVPLSLNEAVPTPEEPDELEAIDLGLSVNWSNKNVGASKITDDGDYFAWGATEPWYSSLDPLTWKDGKTGYNWASYHYGTSNSGLTKYNTNSSYGTVDNKTTLEPTDDAASVNWGGTWRMPTAAEFQELISNTTSAWVTNYNGSGINGYTFTGNGNTIFLPAAGYRLGTDLSDAGTGGYYWSSSLYESYESSAWYLSFNSSYAYTSNNNRFLGQSVRGVQPKDKTAGGSVDDRTNYNQDSDSGIMYDFYQRNGYTSGSNSTTDGWDQE